MSFILFFQSVIIGLSVFILSVNLIDRRSLPNKLTEWVFVVGSVLVMLEWYIKY